MLDLLGQPIPDTFARIAVERGIDRYPDGLTYGVPDDLLPLYEGDRVIVPLGRGDTPTPGYVIEILDHTDAPADKLKLIAQRDEHGVRLPESLMRLARWVSNYYCTPIGMTLASMLPAAVKRGIGSVTKQMIDLGAPLPLPTPDDKKTKRPPKQRAVLEYLAGLKPTDRPVEIRELADAAGLKTVGPIKKLLEAGHLELIARTSIEAAWGAQAVDDFIPDALSPAQQKVMADLAPRMGAGFSAHLLFGVTGSGKTEIYIRLMEQVLAAGRMALMLVPEISLTPQTAGRLIGRFRTRRIAILHSGLTAAQRNQQWSLAASGEADIVIGARSAIFAPVSDDRLGLIIVDEEHDGSYKQDQAPRYNGRDVAVRRAHLAGCPVVLGSATPSLESWHNATERGVFTLHQLPQRVPGVRLPRVHVVDFAAERRKRTDKRVHLMGPVLEDAVGRTLHAGAQVLLLLNRRGYANYIACPDQRCGWVMQCDHCDVTMVYHKHGALPSGGFVRCHHCDAEQRLPKVCPDCGRKISTFGLGTQRVEEELMNKFPRLAEPGLVARVDSDTMRSAKDFHDVLGRFGAGDIKVLVGTQMIAKGLHYPNVRLVGVINADTAINLPDFRATERTFQLVSQVAGRSGRGEGPDGAGVVIVQSFHVDTPAIQLAAAHDFPTFAQREIEERRACGLPPTARMARIVVRDEDHVRAFERAKIVGEGLRKLAGETLRVRGPAPCPISRIASFHRQQVEILAPTAKELQALLTAARNRGMIAAGATMAVDVDPIALL